MDISSAFLGITTPVETLYSQIAAHGWQPKGVKWDKKANGYVAEATNQYGEVKSNVGPDAATALAFLLGSISRHTQMRTAAMWKVGMWSTRFTDQLQEIADAYAKAPIYDPKAAAAFKELGDDSLRRAEVLGHELHIEVTNDPEPYTTLKEMKDDVHDKRHIFVSRAALDHPVWSSDQHVAFRAVHDVLGHVVSGGGFDWSGENLACAAHFPLLTPTAQSALFTECLGQTAYATSYRAFGPQRVALLPDFIEPAQRRENSGAAHRGVHPSQSIAPVKVPQLDHEKPEDKTPPSFVNAPVINLAKIAGPGALIDPNAVWQSGEQPMSLETHGVGNAYLDHGDPMQSQAVMDNAALIDTGWHSLKRGDGSFDRDRAKLAICNAFRVVLLSPRKDLRWNAVHYQDISHIPANTDDPKVYWDALEKARRNWNESQGIDPNAHMIYFKYLRPFEAVVYQLHPELGHQGAKEKAEKTLFDWWTEEQQRIMADDEKKPADKQRTADEIERRANEALAKRLDVYLKDKFNQKTDVQADEPEQISMFGKASAEQYNLLTGQPALKYGAFMGTHLKAISQISQHADEILDAAMEDVRQHDGAGHHFRATVLNLGISGVGPKVCSFAWLLLQPMTSQLGTIDTHMMDVLGHDYEKEMNNRDYFKFERELAAGRDAAGYGHVPLGAFQWGMWDYKRTGEGSHQDHSAMAVLDPKPHQNIDWASKAQNLKGESWLEQAPDWWRNTQNAREKAAQDFERNIAPNVAQNKIPYQVAPPVLTAQSSVLAGESKNEFHVGLAVPDRVAIELERIAETIDMTEREERSKYHMTVLWSEKGYDDPDLHKLIANAGGDGFRFTNARLEVFPGYSDKGDCVVMRFDSPAARRWAHKLMDDVEDHGLEIKRFEGGWKAHVTLGWTNEKNLEGKYPIEFSSGAAYVSVPRPLRRTAEAFSKGFGHWWNNEKPHGINDAKKMAEYAAGTKTSRKEATEFIEKHKEDVRGDFEAFKERFLAKFDRLRKDSSAPRETIMQRLRRETQLPTVEIWKLGEGAGTDGQGHGEQHLRDQVWPIGEGVPAA